MSASERSGQSAKIADAFRRAVALQQQNNLSEAERLCRTIIAAMPKHFDARHLLGVLCFQQGRAAEAADVLAAAVKLQPDAAVALCNYGLVLQELGQHQNALAAYDQALRLQPDYADLLNNRASALIELKRFAEAVAAYDRLLALRPGLFEGYVNRGIALRELRRYPEALASYDKALALAPHHFMVLHHRGIVLDELGRHEEALASYDKALAIKPDDPELLNNRGIALDWLRRHEAAVASYDKAIAIKRDYLEALSNRASARIALRRFDEAMADYDKSLSFNPDYGPGHWNKSLLLLRLGLFEAGWREFEWRRKKDTRDPRHFKGAEWNGEDAAGKRLLFYAETGLGDTIQFARFAAVVAETGANVTLEVQPPLVKLMGSLAGVTIVPAREEPPECDFHLPLMSLPRVLAVAGDTIPTKVPYLAAEPDRVERWARRPPRDVFKVGIAWQGNPHPNIDIGRSAPLRAFAPLARIPGVRLISLQKNAGAEQLRDLPAGMTVETLGDEFDAGPDAFLDSAAVMMNLDLVVSTDTALPHLAGALGRPVWIALKQVPDWRWMMDRPDCPWYPTARLFRQSRRDDWDGVFAQIASELARVAGERGRPTNSEGAAAQAMSAHGAGAALAPVSFGELIDKIVILEIKASKLTDQQKLANVRSELALLTAVRAKLPLAGAEIDELAGELRQVNETLWDVEDRIRDCERDQNFGPEFIELARSVYRTNDRRSALKRQINLLAGSAIVEEKSYRSY